MNSSGLFDTLQLYSTAMDASAITQKNADVIGDSIASYSVTMNRLMFAIIAERI